MSNNDFFVQDVKTGEVLPADHPATQLVNDPKLSAWTRASLKRKLRDLALKGWTEPEDRPTLAPRTTEA